MMQCPKCGATWESPNGANEMQFVICKDCLRKLRAVNKKAAITISMKVETFSTILPKS
jgi:tRNA(Ile2) C34 agmatinyltransferase TiaS